MDHSDHLSLLKPADLPQGGIWADLGAGTGAFTLALSEIIGLSAEIYAVDRDQGALTKLIQSHRARFGTSQNVHTVKGDFTGTLSLPPLDGILMANSLHFYREKEKVLRHIRSFLKWSGRLLLVEYNVDSGNPWVPHPLSFDTFYSLATRIGFSGPQLLAKVPSRFLREFYSAITYRSSTDNAS
jgi:ubiquinone/menaquinone biosynthesis C-methylase UbiE